MKEKWALIEEWFNKHNERDKLFLFLVGLVIIYLVNYILIAHPVSLSKKSLQESLYPLQTQKTTLEQQINVLLIAIKNPVFLKKIEEQKRLIALLSKLQDRLNKLKPTVFSEKEIPGLTKDILKAQNRVTLVSLKEKPSESWPPDNTVNKNTLMALTAGEIYQHPLEIEFQNDFFGTLNYIKLMEKLPWHIYWDSMEYKVLEYPKADVIIRFHVLSIQKS